MTNTNSKTRNMTQLALLISIQLVLAITPLGFLQIGPMTVVLIHIPVLIGAIVIGPSAGGLLGLVFGIASVLRATYIGTPDVLIYTPFLSGSLWSLVISIVPRVLFGLLAGYLFIALKKTKMNTRLAAGITGGVASFAHTIMVLGSIYLFLGEMFSSLSGIAYDTLLAVFIGITGYNGSIEAIIAVIACTLIAPPLIRFGRSR